MNTPEQIARLMERMGRLISNSYLEDGFKPVQWEVLLYLNQANVFSRNPSALGEYLGVTKGSISQTLSTLEDRGLIKKKSDKKDKRAVCLELTAAGRARVASNPLQKLTKAIDTVDKSAQQELLGTLETILLEQLDQRGRKPFGQCRHCIHHRNKQGKLRCALLDVPLAPPSAVLICVEFEKAG